jgi:hypothetical protein
MESEFLTAVDAAVAQALPVDWPRVPQHRLPHCGGTRARHAFRRRGGQGAASYLAVVAVPAAEPHPGALDGELAALVELVLARGAGLLLLYEANAAHADWLLDHLAFPHSHLLTVACTRVPAPAAGPAIPSEPYSAEPTWSGREPLSRTLHDLWTGSLFYDGPQEGPQTVGVECLRDVCWRCSRPLATITGIVFPDRAVADWAHPEWAYYQQLAEVAALPEPVIAALAAAVDSWRALGETRLTPIRWRYSKTVAHSYWAAECPGCGAFRGAREPCATARSTSKCPASCCTISSGPARLLPTPALSAGAVPPRHPTASPCSGTTSTCPPEPCASPRRHHGMTVPMERPCMLPADHAWRRRPYRTTLPCPLNPRRFSRRRSARRSHSPGSTHSPRSARSTRSRRNPGAASAKLSLPGCNRAAQPDSGSSPRILCYTEPGASRQARDP